MTSSSNGATSSSNGATSSSNGTTSSSNGATSSSLWVTSSSLWVTSSSKQNKFFTLRCLSYFSSIIGQRIQGSNNYTIFCMHCNEKVMKNRLENHMANCSKNPKRHELSKPSFDFKPSPRNSIQKTVTEHSIELAKSNHAESNRTLHSR